MFLKIYPKPPPPLQILCGFVLDLNWDIIYYCVGKEKYFFRRTQMKLKKTISIILLLAIIIGTFSTAFAMEPPPATELSDDPAATTEQAAVTESTDADDASDTGVPDEETEPVPSEIENPKSDIDGHWAQVTLEKAIEDKLISGFDDGTIRPDDAITTAQMITILMRLLGATQIKTDGLITPTDAWYYEAAAKAVFLDLLEPHTTNLDTPMTRQDAFAMTACAFAMTPAMPNEAGLNAFSDAGLVTSENRAAMAALITAKIVQGNGGALNANGSISRAEFCTIIYRIVPNIVSPSGITNNLTGGTIVRGDAIIYALPSNVNLWLDCSSISLSLGSVTVPQLTIKSHELKSLSIGYGAKIGTLVLDASKSSVKLGTLGGVTINTLRIQNGGEHIITDSVIENIEITGKNQTVTIDGTHKSIIVSGSNNTVILSENADISELIVIGSGNFVGTERNHNVASPAPLGKTKIGSLTVGGDKNMLYINSGSAIRTISVTGTNATIDLYTPEIETLTLSGSNNALYMPPIFTGTDGEPEILNISRYILSGANNKIQLPYGTTKSLSVTGIGNSVAVPKNGIITSATIDGAKTNLIGEGKANHLVLNAAACTIEIEITSLEDNSGRLDVDRILGMVSYTYKGDFTLAWAEAHDYEDYEKEIWINAKGYSSKTGYLIWINLAMQRVNIFQGSHGNWELVYSCIVGTGRPGNGTPVGVYDTTYKLAAGWTTGSYTCRPVVGFRLGSGYAFHSRLYYPNSSTLKDPSIGFPVSAGCIRMYDEDINYIYNEIPLGTTVVVY